MINRKILEIARQKLGQSLAIAIKNKKVAIETIEAHTKMSKSIIYNILSGKGYSIDSLLTLCAYLDIHMELHEKSIEHSIINQLGDNISDN